MRMTAGHPHHEEVTAVAKAEVLEKKSVRDILMGLLDAYNSRDVDKVLAFFTEDVEWSEPTLTEPLKGKAAAAEAVASVFRAFPDMSFEAIDIYETAEGKAAAVSMLRGTFTGPVEPPGFAPTGKAVEFQTVCLYELRDGLIAKHQIVYDMMALMVQMGLMPAPESPVMKVSAGMQRLTTPLVRRVLRR
jgi:steroid delta-isomerase-like uncharacterized protein